MIEKENRAKLTLWSLLPLEGGALCDSEHYFEQIHLMHPQGRRHKFSHRPHSTFPTETVPSKA